uniref:Putative conserved plasma membrane protein n=1 Tax=Tabanus bromius TaxID=304241 RepID=A0A0K8TQ20_TABBR
MSGTIQKNEYPKASGALVFSAVLTYISLLAIMMSFCAPYWIESYSETNSEFKNMGLWEYCFKQFTYPYYQLMRKFDGCHNIFGQEFYVIREYLVPGWLMAVQTFVTIAFLLTIIGMVTLSLELIRWPLKTVLRYEWIMTRISFICNSVSSLCLFLGVAIFGGCAYRRDWLMYPKFNCLSWAYALAVAAFMILGLTSYVLHREAVKSYEARSEAKNLVMQMEMQEPGNQPSSRNFSRSPTGYI